MKKPYEELELEVVRFGAEDVITASQEDMNDGGDDTGRDGGGDTSATEDPGKEEPTPA